jgi:fatty-acyl-CoA synthase
MKGPTVMLGYWDMPEKTAETIRDGWLYSGDLGRLDDDGFLYIMGRAKDMIISGGENIYPAEIERVLKEHPDVRDVAVVGVPDPEWSESVLAVVVPEDGGKQDANGLIEFVRARLAGFKKPRFVEFVDALPSTSATGKVQKAELRKRFAHLARR